MNKTNTPIIKTKRLILRPFTQNDGKAVLSIFSDEAVTTHLPLFPLKSLEEAKQFLQERCLNTYENEVGYRYAVCLKEDDIPIGFVNVEDNDSHDFGYGLKKEYWNQKIITEASQAVVDQIKKDGHLPYITAIHDIKNPASGKVMKKFGMRYCYTYEEQWQPKDVLVTFRMYQLNFDGNDDSIYQKYWNESPLHFIEEDV